ncbi:NAD-dependent DNA ligase LigA [Rathayibacter rathayi]|uniref:NAD-dependent DNA ligase LigA n=1 Tax=Rathayibacter rathayi TaxID=33887 RepID=UPI000CE8B681|nr:NAD-dependent DNA ligase LigA [Rathayibacter rathayi]PPG14430.1 NAD-dependent DNA ligase LigA [Rathayibacter rathayi]
MIATPTDYREAVQTALAAATSYYDGPDSLLSDADYDQLLDTIAAFEDEYPSERVEHKLFTSVSAGTSGGGDVTHATPMLSLDKANTLEEISAFLAKVPAGTALSVEPKLDGIAVSVTYVGGVLTRVATRGDGVTGEDITDRVLAIAAAGLPRHIDAPADMFEVRGELVMSRDDFTYSNASRVAAGKPAFANPRNATAGSVRKSSLDYDVSLSFVVYDSAPAAMADALTDLGFTPSALLLPATDDVLAQVTAFGELRKGTDFAFPTDGIVIKVTDLVARQALGSTSRAPRWAMAYKYAADRAVTTLRAIEVGVGRTGNISYTALLEPVLIDGSTVARATLHNPKFIADRDIRIGDRVSVHKANDIIPRVELSFPEHRDHTSIPYEPSTVCPISGTELNRSGEIWRSTAPEASLGALIAYAASRDALDIDGLGTEVADALIESNRVSDLGDLFTLTVADLATLSLNAGSTDVTPRLLGEKNAAKIHANIQAAKAQPLNRFITALGIRKSGRTFGRRLANHFHTFDTLLATDEAGFLASGVEGIGPERARLFADGFQAALPVIEKLRAAGATMGETPVAGATADKPLDGMKVVVSGAMSGTLASLSRNEMNELIESLGGASSGSVSKATSLLVSSEAGTSKATKATALGVSILTPEEFAAMIGH